MKCDFCGNELSKGTGKMYVKKDTRVLYFCSMKCEKNLLKFNRVPREHKWTQAAIKLKEKPEAAAPKEQKEQV